jgi:undecaprenyl-diphosphatase
MKDAKSSKKDHGTPIKLPETKQLWIICVILGALFWIIGLVLWWQQGLDKAVLFYFNPMRIAKAPMVIFSKWLTSYGMAAITSIFITYLILSKVIKSLDAPLTIYFYTICSFGISGIAGDLLKFILARPRPLATFGSELLIWSDSTSYAIPSGHATKSIALILPFLLIVSNNKALHKGIKILTTLIAVGVCFSRIVLGAHYVSDVLAGIGTALIGLPVSMMFANMVLRKAKQEKLPTLSIVWGLLLVFLTAVFMTI